MSVDYKKLVTKFLVEMKVNAANSAKAMKDEQDDSEPNHVRYRTRSAVIAWWRMAIYDAQRDARRAKAKKKGKVKR